MLTTITSSGASSCMEVCKRTKYKIHINSMPRNIMLIHFYHIIIGQKSDFPKKITCIHFYAVNLGMSTKLKSNNKIFVHTLYYCKQYIVLCNKITLIRHATKTLSHWYLSLIGCNVSVEEGDVVSRWRLRRFGLHGELFKLKEKSSELTL